MHGHFSIIGGHVPWLPPQSLCLCVKIGAWDPTCVYHCMCVFMCVCMTVCVCVGLFVYVFVSVYVCMYVPYISIAAKQLLVKWEILWCFCPYSKALPYWIF